MSRINYVLKNRIQKVKKQIKETNKTDKVKINMLMSELEKSYLENAKLKMKLCGYKDFNRSILGSWDSKNDETYTIEDGKPMGNS